MKIRQHIIPCGRVIFFEETTPKDLAMQKTMYKRLHANKKALSNLVHPDSVGRKNIKWAQNVYNKFTTLLTRELASRLIQGDRLTTLNGHMWMIAARKDSGKYLNWHSDGKSYGVVIRGLNAKFGVKLSRARRKELKEKIENGQTYHE